MAKKVFYRRRYRLPLWGQPYVVWLVLFAIFLLVVLFSSVEKVQTDSPPVLPAKTNGFIEGLFYELREAGNSPTEVVQRYAGKLKKRHGYTVREAKLANCRTVHLERGSNPPWLVAAELAKTGGNEAVFSVLTFLDVVAAEKPQLAIAAELILAHKPCDPNTALAVLSKNKQFSIFVASDRGALMPNPVGQLYNLKLRRYFPDAFFSPERTLWTNMLALVTDKNQPVFSIAAPQTRKTPGEAFAANPLLSHPALDDANALELSRRVALYLGENTQLYRGGFFAAVFLLWLLAIIPLFNALAVFRESIDLPSALISGVLFSLAFVSYLALLRAALPHLNSNFFASAVAALLIPGVFYPLRVLQNTMLRAELNRCGMHILVQSALTLGLFVAPAAAALSLWQLALASGYNRAALWSKLLRLFFIFLPLFLLLSAATRPMGNYANFLLAWLPSFNVAELPQLVLFCITGGNLTALLFVPREKI
ncbi:MAG: hypothetical protein N2Z22_00610 [Turneriella sp.]|nr:hypothetical protein [Leptospiraceae bacterium]MCX7631812.1 hypothetical protein [Turneriella sp.]